MTKLTININRLAHGTDLPLPTNATDSAAGVDLLAALDDNLILRPGEYQKIPTGIAIALPADYEAQIRPRSGLAAKHGITVLNSPGTIDSDYRGEIGVLIINHGTTPFVLERGMRIAQLIVSPVTRFKWHEKDRLSRTKRSTAGFGSTGVKS